MLTTNKEQIIKNIYVLVYDYFTLINECYNLNKIVSENNKIDLNRIKTPLQIEYKSIWIESQNLFFDTILLKNGLNDY